MSRKLNRYLVGFDQDYQTVYGKNEDGKFKWADPMTLKQARKQLKQLYGRKSKAIYKLVPVRVSKEEHKP